MNDRELVEVDARMAEASAESERQAVLGILPPRFILDATIAQMRLFAGSASADNPFVTEFARKLDALDDIDSVRRSELVSEAALVVENEVYPAWRAAIAVLEAQRTSATDERNGRCRSLAFRRRRCALCAAARELHDDRFERGRDPQDRP